MSLQGARLTPLVPVGAARCRLRPTHVLGLPAGTQRQWIAPKGLLCRKAAGWRPGPRHQRPPSLSVLVASVQDVTGRHVRVRSLQALLDLADQLLVGRERHNAFQFAQEVGLHRLAPRCSSRLEHIPDLCRHVSDCDLNSHACNLPRMIAICKHCSTSGRLGGPFGAIDQPGRSLRQFLRGIPGVLSLTVERYHSHVPESPRKHASTGAIRCGPRILRCSQSSSLKKATAPGIGTPMEVDRSKFRWNRSLGSPWMSHTNSANRSSSHALRKRPSRAWSQPEPRSAGFAAKERNGGESLGRQCAQTSRGRGLQDALVIRDEDRIELSDPKCACKL